MNLKRRLALCWRILRVKPGNLMAHAKTELPNIDPEVEELILVFSSQGHSGTSAQIVTEWVGKLLQYKPLSPLKGTPDEWLIHDQDLDMYAQNKRCSSVFQRRDGTAYDIESGKRVEITFPYMPA